MATALTQTTLSGAISVSATVIVVASATGISAPVGNVRQKLYIIGPGQARGELVEVVGVNSTQIQVQRLDEFRSAWPTGSLVLIGPTPINNQFFEPFQSCDPPPTNDVNTTLSANKVVVTPWVNITTGSQFIYSSILNCWVPGWHNWTAGPPAVTAAVASPAGLMTPTGPLFHVTGTNAITGITTPIGFTHGYFDMIPDGIFTWTAAGNIALAGTAVVNKILRFQWDGTNSKWVPGYIA